MLLLEIILFLTALAIPSKALNLDFYQSDYDVIFERIEVTSYDKKYVNYFKATTFKFNRTCAAFNMSFNFKDNIFRRNSVILQAFKFASNEYRPFPIRFQFNFCDGFDKNIAGVGNFTKCRNFKGCPHEKNKHYEMCNFAIDQSKLPPLIPNGRYLTELTGIYHSVEIWVIHILAEVTRPFYK